jgi:hypothetical protein
MATTRALIDKYLTMASKGYVPEGMIADGLLTPVKVKQDSGKLAGYGNSHLRIVNTVYGGRGKAPRFESITRTSDSYYVEPHGLEGLVTEQDYRNVEGPYDAEKDETLGLVTVLKLSREKALADNLTSTSVLTQNTTLSGTSQFSDYINSDPLGKFKTAQEQVHGGCGMEADTAIMNWNTANTLSYHPGILEGLGFTQNRAGTLKESELASAMKIQNLKIAKAKYNSAKLGQTSTLSNVWGNHIIFAVLPKSAQKFQTSLGYEVRLIGKSPYQTSKWKENNPAGATGILVTDYYDDLLSNVSAAYLIKDAIA